MIPVDRGYVVVRKGVSWIHVPRPLVVGTVPDHHWFAQEADAEAAAKELERKRRARAKAEKAKQEKLFELEKKERTR